MPQAAPMDPLRTPYVPPMDPLWTYGPPMNPLRTPYGPPMDQMAPLWTPCGRKLNIGPAKKAPKRGGLLATSGAPGSKEGQSAYTYLHQHIAHEGNLYLEQRQSWHPQPPSLLQSSPHHRVEHIFFHRQSDRHEEPPSGAHRAHSGPAIEGRLVLLHCR